MISPISHLIIRGQTPGQFFADVFRRLIESLERGNLKCHIPRIYHLYEPHKEMPYHFKPELFVQLGGITEFRFPDECFTLRPGEVCIVPKGMPHGEIVRADKEPFENVVVSFYNDMIDVHIGREMSPGIPKAVEMNFYTTDFFEDMVDYLDAICHFQRYSGCIDGAATKGLLMAEFSLLLALVEAANSHLASATDIVSLCQWLIQHNLQDEFLSVELLAEELDCTPNYLSRVFHKKTGDRITERINRLRIQNASDALRWTRLSIKAIAAGCGYSGANYFCRKFRQATGRTPQSYRLEFQREFSGEILQSGVLSNAGTRLNASS
jgi:AraC-like DNA-binding protein